MKKKSLKYGLFFCAGLIAVLASATVVYLLWLMPSINGKWKSLLVMPWLYGWGYGYYKFTKDYTKWWKEIGE